MAVILDGFSRKVVGWALERTLATRLPRAALEQAIAQRQPQQVAKRRGGCVERMKQCDDIVALAAELAHLEA